MNTEKKRYPYKKAVLYDCNGDLSKRWRIVFYVWHKQQNKKIRRFDYTINQYQTEKQRRKYARDRIETINQLLEDGYIINEEVVHTDTILTIEEALNFALKTLKIAPRSQDSYRSIKNIFINWCKKYNYDKFLIQNFTEKHAFKYFDYMQIEKGLAAKTINNDIGALKRFWKILVDRKIVNETPWSGIEKQKVVTTKKNIAFEWEQVKKIKRIVSKEDPELWEFIQIMYYTLARPTEIRLMQVYNVNFTEKYIWLEAEKTKSKKDRHITLHPDLIPVLIKLTNHKKQTGYLFPGNIANKEISRNIMSQRFRDILHKYEMYDGNHTLYSWKHTGVIQAYKAGVDLKSIQLQCGHSTIAETDNYLKSLGLYKNHEIIIKQPRLPQ